MRAATLIAGFALGLSVAQVHAQTGPVYQPFRYDDDFRYLRSPGHPADLWDPVKDLRFGDSYLSLGGELRERFESYADPLFGLKRQGRDSYDLHRFLAHADLHVSENFRTFIQFGNHDEWGKDHPLAPTDRDRLDLQQGFIDLHAPINDHVDPVLRAGRQEIGLGSQRLVSVRDGTNVRRSFDGLRLFDTFGDVRVDLIATRPTELREGNFDDPSDSSQELWGAYLTAPVGFVPHLKADLYYLGYENELARFAGARNKEIRHSIGTRLFGATAGWDWNFEMVGQFGSFGSEDIRAWTVASDTGFTIASVPWKPRVGLKANIASGDRNPSDGKVGTFNPLFPRLPYFSEATLIVPANFYDLHPSLTVHPTQRVSILLSWDFLWRESTHDAVYSSPFNAIPGTNTATGRRIGDQFALEAQWQVNPHLALAGSYVHFNAASTILEAGGRDVDFVMTSMTYRF